MMKCVNIVYVLPEVMTVIHTKRHGTQGKGGQNNTTVMKLSVTHREKIREIDVLGVGPGFTLLNTWKATLYCSLGFSGGFQT